MLPTWLTVDELVARIDRENADTTLLGEFLEAAFAQAQERQPYGCGRLLSPNPALTGDPLEDTADPVELVLKVAGRTVVVPDAREITQVLGFSDAVLTEGIDYGNYEVQRHKGAIVGLRLSAGRHGYGYDPVRVQWRDDPTWPRSVKVTGRFGFLEVDRNLIEGIYTLAGRMYFERDAQYSDQVRVADGASGEAYFRQLPVRTKLAFQSYAVPAAYSGLS